MFPYTTDVPLLTRWGTPLLLGPGSIHVAHTDEEHVAIDEMMAAVKLYESLARRIAVERLDEGAGPVDRFSGRTVAVRYTRCFAGTPKARLWVRRTAARTLCNFSLRTASGPEGSSAK